MNKLANLMVGIDFSQKSLSAARMAVALAEPTGAMVELVHVANTQMPDSDIELLHKSRAELQELIVNKAEDLLHNFAEQLDYQQIKKIVLVGSNPAAELAKLAEERESNILIVGDTGSDAGEIPRGVGTVAYRLVEQGPRNVLVVKSGYSEVIKTVAAAISFVPVADDVLRRAHLIASLFQAELRVVRVIPDITELRYRVAVLPSDIERIASESARYNEKRLADYVGRYDIGNISLKTAILSGKPGQALVEYLNRESIDLVVMGTGTSYRLAGYPIGSTTHRVLNQTLSSVCIVRSLEPAP